MSTQPPSGFEPGSTVDPTVYLQAPAKLTLSLAMVGIRDDGMHLIDAEMVSLDLCDTLAIRPSEKTTIRLADAGADVPVGGDNLVARALSHVGRTAQVEISKRIPSQAGLGGGSSDAAAILRWAGYSDASAASKLGADVSFCLVGGRARVTGIGEIIDPLEFQPMTVTLLTPPIGCPTPVIYQKWDAMGGPTGDNGNDLEPAALAAFPKLAQWRDKLGNASGKTPMLAGSGSTWFVLGAFPGVGRVVAKTVPAAKTATKNQVH